MTKKLTKKQRLEKCLGAFLSESVGLFKILDRTGSFISSPCITPASAWASAWRYNRRQVELAEASEAYGDGALREIGIDVVCKGLSDSLASLSRLRELGPLAVAEIKRLGSENEALKSARDKTEAALKRIAYDTQEHAALFADVKAKMDAGLNGNRSAMYLTLLWAQIIASEALNAAGEAMKVLEP